MITDRDHEVFFDLGCLAFDFCDEFSWQDALAKCLNQATSELVLLDEMVCQEGVGLVRVFMEVAKRNRELVHAADELGSSNSVTVITDECDLHEVFENDPPEEIDKLVRGAFHHFHSCERKVQFTDEIAHHFVPQGMPLIEIAAFVRESVKREVVR